MTLRIGKDEDEVEVENENENNTDDDAMTEPEETHRQLLAACVTHLDYFLF